MDSYINGSPTRRRRSRTFTMSGSGLVAAAVLIPLGIRLEGSRPLSAERPAPVPIALFALAFYGEHANSIEPGDSGMGAAATVALRRYLGAVPGVQLIDSATLVRLMSLPAAQAAAGDKPCPRIIACVREVAAAAHARWAVTGTISKTSNLIWIYSGQLVDTSTKTLVLDDEYELKGNSRDLVPQGSRVFAGRVGKKLGLGPPDTTALSVR